MRHLWDAVLSFSSIAKPRNSGHQALVDMLAGALAKHGFKKGVCTDASSGPVLLRQTPEGTQGVIAFVWDKHGDAQLTSDAWLEIRDTRVQELNSAFRAGCAKYPIARFKLSALVEDKTNFSITSPGQLKAFVQLVEKTIPALADRCRHIKELDALVNGDRSVIGFMELLENDAALVMAYLASNPRFEALFASADERFTKPPEDPVGYLGRLVSHLRANVKPLA